MSSRSSITIGQTEIKAGERVTTDISIARLYTHTEMTMPVHVIHGKKDGPVLFVSAAIHGDEINGVEIVRRLLNLKLLKNMRGTLIAIPIVNVYGFINTSRYLPDRRDLNRSFPGNPKGSLASHLADLFMNEIVAKSTHGIDIHTAANHRSNLPQIRANLEHPEVERLAQCFGAPVIVNARLRDNSLREAVIDRGIPMLLYEAGEALRFNEHPIRIGLRGIVSVMRELGMLSQKRAKKHKITPVIVERTRWVRAPKSGIIHSAIALGSIVKKNDIMARIVDPYDDKEEKISAPFAGIVIGTLSLPLVHKGDAIFHVASVGRQEDLEELSNLAIDSLDISEEAVNLTDQID